MLEELTQEIEFLPLKKVVITNSLLEVREESRVSVQVSLNSSASDICHQNLIPLWPMAQGWFVWMVLLLALVKRLWLYALLHTGWGYLIPVIVKEPVCFWVQHHFSSTCLLNMYVFPTG